MTPPTAEVVICGAGIAGIAAAYHLAVRRGITDVVLVDERAPLTLTSDKSAECYRNWWPGPGDDMVAVMNRSIDLLEELARESDNAIRLNRRGYLFATAEPGASAAASSRRRARRPRGARGPSACTPAPAATTDLQPPRGSRTQPDGDRRPHRAGADAPILPVPAEDTVAVLHARRCGWLSGQQLGMYMLERAREKGVRLVEGRVTASRPRAAACARSRVSTREGTPRSRRRAS